jgi:hypothetical protein
MSSVLRSVAAVCGLLLLGVAANAQSEAVGTSASESATYGTVSQNAGPFPWSDLGITASASVSQGVLDVSTGGSTTFKLNSTVTSGESFVAGSTVLNLGYTPSWTGTFSSATAANGNLNSNFVYNIGPFSGSKNLLNVPLNVPGATTGNLAPSLNNLVVSPPVSNSSTVGGPGIIAGLGVQAQACFIVCVTVASANVNFNVGTQIQQNIVAAPAVTYGDLVWESKSQTYSASDHFTFVPGVVGNIANTFTAPPASLGLTTGQTFYYNFLPVVQLDMPVINDAQVSVPASISASWNIFGFGGSETWPLGNLYSLNTGAAAFDFNPDFNGSNFYSIPLEYTAGYCVAVACFGPSYITPPSGGGPTVTLTGGGVPSDSGPCGALLIGCGINVPDGPGEPGGYGQTNLGPLFPPEGPTGMVCGPAGTPDAGECITQVIPTSSTPEPADALLLGIGLLGLAIFAPRKLFAARA